MIEKYNPKHELDLLDYVQRFGSKELYLTENKIRIPVTNKILLKKFINNSKLVYVKTEKGDVCGVLIRWTSNSENVKREYIKLSAINVKDAGDLLTIMIWETKTDLYIKVDNNSHLMPALLEKGFRFFAGRGEQILMKRQFIYVSKSDDSRDKNKKPFRRFQQNDTRPVHIRQ